MLLKSKEAVADDIINKVIAYFNVYKFASVLFFLKAQAQQLNCTVSVNAQRLSNSNQQILNVRDLLMNL
jgi:hypothetical protein